MRPGELARLLPRTTDAEVTATALGLVVRVQPAQLGAVIGALRNAKPPFRMLVDVFGTDTGELIEMTYHLRRLAPPLDVYVKCPASYDAELASVWRSYPAALYPEREAAELLGLSFRGHPNPERLLTTDEVDGYMLRKSALIREDDEVRRRD